MLCNWLRWRIGGSKLLHETWILYFVYICVIQFLLKHFNIKSSNNKSAFNIFFGLSFACNSRVMFVSVRIKPWSTPRGKNIAKIIIICIFQIRHCIWNIFSFLREFENSIYDFLLFLGSLMAIFSLMLSFACKPTWHVLRFCLEKSTKMLLFLHFRSSKRWFERISTSRHAPEKQTKKKLATENMNKKEHFIY